MATTATLNGGPTGGLHATPIIHTDSNPPQEETCRVDSNSSFESGHEDTASHPTWTSGSTSLCPNESDLNESSKGNSKKRRKQSCPVRIPASEAELSGAIREEGELPRMVVDESEVRRSTGGHVPLNLSSRNENNSSSEDDSEQARSSLLLRVENDKTEDIIVAGQGTKDSLTPSFSPGLFPPGHNNNPFTSLFPGSVNLFSHHHQHLQHANNNNNPGTPASSVGSDNSLGPGGTLGGNPGLVSGSSLPNLPPHRIFNPEAYCDLCNKEFCNKYFLKTHKANKHGVYTEMSPSLGMGSTASNTSFLTGTPILSSAGLSNTSQPSANSLLQQQQLQQQLQSSSSFSTSNKGPSSDIPFSLGSFSMEKGAGSSNGSQGRESFCELCQKEFCNKYFLKRHKAKIHGIPIDSCGGGDGSGRSSNSNSNHGKSSGQRSNFSNGITSDSIKREGLSQSLREIGLETLGLELVTKRLVDEAKEEGELSADECTHASGNGNNDKSCKVEESDESCFKMSSTSDIKGENTCQFCFREFSSKQQLCNHLVKKHRLLIPSSFSPFLLPFPGLFTPQQTQSEALSGQPDSHANSTPTEATAVAAAAALAAGLLDSNGNTLQSGDSDFECNLCNRSFQTIYLLRMHKSYFHPESAAESEEDGLQQIGARERERRNPRESKQRLDTEEDCENDQGSNSENESSRDSGKVSPIGIRGIDESHENNSKGPVSKCGTNRKESSIAEIEGRGEATSDSDDLRRLQTMIMELNRVSSAAVAWSPPLDTSPCVGNQQHIQHYHSGSAGGSNTPFILGGTGDSAGVGGVRIKSESPLNAAGTGGNVTPTGDSQHSIRIKSESELGGKKSSSLDPLLNITQGTLKERLLHPEGFLQSFGSSEGPPTSTFLTPGPKGSSSSMTPTGSNNNNNNNNNNIIKSDSGANKRPSPSLSRSYCTICHKELCNKYFMRTHMLKMHGISIESSTGLGGVTCDICNKELCSKYFLKVHKQNTHGIIEDGPSPPNPSTPGPVSNSSSNFPLLNPSSVGSGLSGLNLSTNSGGPGTSQQSSLLLQQNSSLREIEGNNNSTGNNNNNNGHTIPLDPSSLPLLPKEVQDLQTRYFYHYSESCPFCGRRFRSSKWLKTHLQSDHGEEGRERWKAIEKTLNASQRRQHHPQVHSHSSQHYQQQKSSSSSKISSSGGGGGGTSTNNNNNCPSQIKGSSVTGRNGEGNKSNPILKSSNNSSSALTRDGNRCAFCNFSSVDVEIMKNHLIKEHSSQLSSRQTQAVLNAEAAAMNVAAINAAALNALNAAASGYPSEGQQNHPGSAGGILLDPLTMLFQKMEGGSNKLYRCTYCPFTTSILVYLYAHERTHTTGLGGAGTTSASQLGGSVGESTANFQCPMCFHTFDQPDTFQQHLIGHQMSGVLAPFFTPHQSPSSGGRLGFLSSPSGIGSSLDQSSSSLGGHGGGGSSLLSLPLLNGNTGESLYWALKNNLPLKTNGEEGGGNKSEEGYNQHNNEDDETSTTIQDLTRKKRKISEAEVDECCKPKPRKRSHFRCSYCSLRFKSRDQCVAHIRSQHSHTSSTKPKRREEKSVKVGGNFGEVTESSDLSIPRKLGIRTEKKNNLFRCRRCKFSSLTYQRLVVHCKLHHRRPQQSNNMRGAIMKSKGTGTEWKFPPEVQGIPQGDGEFVMQGFLLTSSEEESSNQSSGYFVPSLVYLPVREKVSQSIRVSFSLTPTS